MTAQSTNRISLAWYHFAMKAVQKVTIPLLDPVHHRTSILHQYPHVLSKFPQKMELTHLNLKGF